MEEERPKRICPFCKSIVSPMLIECNVCGAHLMPDKNLKLCQK